MGTFSPYFPVASEHDSHCNPSLDPSLKNLLVEILGINLDTYDDDDTAKALAAAGIVGFHKDMTKLTEVEID